MRWLLVPLLIGVAVIMALALLASPPDNSGGKTPTASRMLR